MAPLIDSHAHLNDPRFATDLPEVVERAKAEGISDIINVGYDLESSRRAIELADAFPGLWAVVGLHPHDAKEWDSAYGKALEELCGHPKVLAIGEIGLDYHYDHSPREQQRRVFQEQLKLAQKLQFPAVIHSREAAQDTLEIIQESGGVRCLLHCYSGSLEMARVYERLDCFFSFGGPLTFQNARRVREVAAGIPLERILLETDCPYLTPHPHRGKRNEPAYLGLIARKLAEVLERSLEDVIRLTAQNTRLFFGFDQPDGA